jgi:acyl carrier protein
MEIIERIQAVIRKVLDVPDLHLRPEMTAQSVEGWDSMAHIHIMLAIEREFKIKLKAADAMGAKNISELVELVQEKFESNHPQ